MNKTPTRRQFLRTSGLAAGTAIAAPYVRGQEDQIRSASLEGRIFKAVKCGRRDDESPLEFFNRLKELGFAGVECGNAREADAYAAASRATGVVVHGTVCGWHWGTRLSSPDESMRARGLELLRKDILDTHLLGGSSVMLVPGTVCGRDETHDHVWHRSIAEVRKALPLASRLRIRILIATVRNGFCQTPGEFRDYLDAFDSPWVGAYLDLGKVQPLVPAEEWIRTLGSRVVKLNVTDGGKHAGCTFLGEGEVDWDAVRLALQEINFSGWATREGLYWSQWEDTAALMDHLLLGKPASEHVMERATDRWLQDFQLISRRMRKGDRHHSFSDQQAL